MELGVDSNFDMVDSIMAQVDIGESGFISFSEFVNATVNWTK